MDNSANNPKLQLDRREFLNWGRQGLGATALASLLLQECQAGNPMQVQDNGRAKRAIHIWLVGGLSHLDSFDYKPELEKMHGKSLETDEQVDLFFGQMGQLRQPDWEVLSWVG